jgi:glycosyltransferase involved in cell wall biosynthesis
MQATESSMDKNDLPLVTIVTPTYNQADYLAETIDSVLAQDYPNIEYIVIDDGSTDHTDEILKQYDGRIRWESQANMGQAATLNRGWEMGSGEIIGYLSSDDLLKPNAVSESVNGLLNDPDIVLVYPDFELIDAVGNHIRNVKTPEYSEFDLTVNLICQPGPGAFFWKKHFELIGGWNDRLSQIPDFEYWLRLSLKGDFKRIPKILTSSRVHKASQSFKIVSVDRAMEPVKVIDEYSRVLISPRLAPWSHRAKSKSHLLAARMLFRSGRLHLGSGQLWESFCQAPLVVFSIEFWHVLINAIFGKLFHRVFFKMNR